jgi:hypothetical protein
MLDESLERLHRLSQEGMIAYKGLGVVFTQHEMKVHDLFWV